MPSTLEAPWRSKDDWDLTDDEWDSKYGKDVYRIQPIDDIRNPNSPKYDPDWESKGKDQVRIQDGEDSVPTGQDPANIQGDDYFDLTKFEQLLDRLESSKGRQQRQKSIEGRRDTWSQGLANMMSNF